MSRVRAEGVEARALQSMRVESRQRLADLVLVAREGRLCGLVQVDDLVVGIRQHHAGGDFVECLTDARVLRCHRALGLDLGAQLALHVVQRAQHLACFIRAGDVDLVVVPAAGDIAEHRDRSRQGLLEGVSDQPGQAEREGEGNGRDAGGQIATVRHFRQTLLDGDVHRRVAHVRQLLQAVGYVVGGGVDI